MFDKLKAWNEDQRAKARVRRDAAAAKLRGVPHATTIDGESADLRAWVKANKQHRIGALAGVHLFADKIVRLNPWPAPGGEAAPLAGVEAHVDNQGGISGRATLTRTAVPGAHGWQKKIDTRETWLVIDGPDFQWTAKVEQMEAGQARAFAAAITTAGRKAAATG